MKSNSIVTKLNDYWFYLKTYLKNPSAIFNRNDGEFVFGSITFALFLALIGFANFGMKKSFMLVETSFGLVMRESTLFTGMCAILAISTIFIICKVFGPAVKIQTIVGFYGTYLIPIIGLVLLTFVAIVFKLAVFGTTFLFATLLYALLFLPLYILTKLFHQQPAEIDPLYSYLSFIVMYSVLVAVFFIAILDMKVTTIF